MAEHADLGPYCGWVRHAAAEGGLYPPVDRPGLTGDEVRSLIGSASDGEPLAPEKGRRWTRDGVSGEEVSWSVGYGPRTQAWLLRPVDASGPLPGVLALHGHDGFTFFGKEKIADGPDPTPESIPASRAKLYERTAFACELARRGYSTSRRPAPRRRCWCSTPATTSRRPMRGRLRAPSALH